MANELIKVISQNKKTYTECRQFIFNLVGKDKSKLSKVENANVSVVIPYLIRFIETKIKDFKEVISYYGFDRPDLDFYTLLKVSIIGCFRKIENNDTNFEPF